MPRFALIVLLALPVLAASAQEPAAEPPAQDGTEAVRPASVDPADVRLFARLFSLVRQGYVEPIDDHALMQAAIEGMLARLDPHNALLDQRGLQQLDEDARGQYAGVGIRVTDVDGDLQVIAPLDDTPAARAGIRSGDIIIAVDGDAVDEDNIDFMVERLRGAPGSKVRLSILRGDTDEAREFELVRERIRVTSVRSGLLQPGYAWLRISEFQQDTARQLGNAVRALRRQGALAGVVLDLRNNPGGLLDAAVQSSDLFLDSGRIVSTRGRLEEMSMEFNALPGDLLEGLPMVVLVDQGTASAAEIMAGALRDQRRAVLMGQRTFGKGSVQSILDLGEGWAVKLTTARYYTPAGTSIQAEGIVPDITLADLAVHAPDTPPVPVLREAALAHHLDNEDGASAAAGNDDDAGALALEDYAMSAALNVLKALVLARAPAGAAVPERR